MVCTWRTVYQFSKDHRVKIAEVIHLRWRAWILYLWLSNCCTFIAISPDKKRTSVCITVMVMYVLYILWHLFWRLIRPVSNSLFLTVLFALYLEQNVLASEEVVRTRNISFRSSSTFGIFKTSLTWKIISFLAVFKLFILQHMSKVN